MPCRSGGVHVYLENQAARPQRTRPFRTSYKPSAITRNHRFRRSGHDLPPFRVNAKEIADLLPNALRDRKLE